MSDISHLEYCVRLGNTILENKLEQMRQGTYIQPNNRNFSAQNFEQDNFKDRIKNWN